MIEIVARAKGLDSLQQLRLEPGVVVVHLAEAKAGPGLIDQGDIRRVGHRVDRNLVLLQLSVEVTALLPEAQQFVPEPLVIAVIEYITLPKRRAGKQLTKAWVRVCRAPDLNVHLAYEYRFAGLHFYIQRPDRLAALQPGGDLGVVVAQGL